MLGQGIEAHVHGLETPRRLFSSAVGKRVKTPFETENCRPSLLLGAEEVSYGSPVYLARMWPCRLSEVV